MDSGLGSGWALPALSQCRWTQAIRCVVPSLARAVADSVDFFTGDEIVCASGIPLQLKVVAFDSMKRIRCSGLQRRWTLNTLNRKVAIAHKESGARMCADHDAMGSDIAALPSRVQPRKRPSAREPILGIPGGPVWTVLHPKNLRHDGAAHVDAVWHLCRRHRGHILAASRVRTEITVVWEMPDGTRTNTVTFAVRCLPGSPAAPQAFSESQHGRSGRLRIRPAVVGRVVA